MLKFLLSFVGGVCMSIQTVHANDAAIQAARSVMAKAMGFGDNISIKTCGEHSLTDTCIGEAKENNCKTDAINGTGHSDEFATLMMVAHSLHAGGIKLCPTQIEANNWNVASELKYFYPDGNTQCVWLCMPGYTGAECKTKSDDDNSATICDGTPFTRDGWHDTKITKDGSNIKSDVVILDTKKWPCKDSNKTDRLQNDHHLIMTISKWLPSGNGAFVQPTVVQAWRHTKETSKPILFPAVGGNELLMCKNGFARNANNTDCEPIDKAACELQAMLDNLCDRWDATKYDEQIHEIHIKDNCYQYLCAEPDTAFVSKTNHTCTPCAKTKKQGTNPIDGTCVKCDTGYLFNENAINSGFCEKALAISKTDMMYGIGKTKNTNTKLTDQCWTILGADEYKKCILNGDLTK